MNLLILDGQASGYGQGNPSYRGTYRAFPYYCDEYPADHDVNEAFFWFVEEGGEDGIVHHVDRARKLVRLYREYSGQHFDIVEVTHGLNEAEIGTEFLGFDLSAGLIESLLWWGLDFGRADEPNTTEEVLQPLLCLIQRYFQPKLNANGLFDDYETAQACLDSLMALQRLRPGTFEGGTDYEVVGVYLVSPVNSENSE